MARSRNNQTSLFEADMFSKARFEADKKKIEETGCLLSMTVAEYKLTLKRDKMLAQKERRMANEE